MSAPMINGERPFSRTKLPFDFGVRVTQLKLCANVCRFAFCRKVSTVSLVDLRRQRCRHTHSHGEHNKSNIETNGRLCYSVCAKQFDKNRRGGDNCVTIYFFSNLFPVNSTVNNAIVRLTVLPNYDGRMSVICVRQLNQSPVRPLGIVLCYGSVSNSIRDEDNGCANTVRTEAKHHQLEIMLRLGTSLSIASFVLPIHVALAKSKTDDIVQTLTRRDDALIELSNGKFVAKHRLGRWIKSKNWNRIYFQLRIMRWPLSLAATEQMGERECMCSLTQKPILKMKLKSVAVSLREQNIQFSLLFSFRFSFFAFRFSCFRRINQKQITTTTTTNRPIDRILTSGNSSGTFPIHDSDTIEQSHFVFVFFSKCKCIVMSTVCLRFLLVSAGDFFQIDIGKFVTLLQTLAKLKTI